MILTIDEYLEQAVKTQCNGCKFKPSTDNPFCRKCYREWVFWFKDTKRYANT